MHKEQALTALSAIAQSARLDIFRCLVQAGPEGMAAGVLSESLQIANSTLSFHLKALTHANLISARQESRFIYYTANYAQMNDLLAYLTENCCGGNTRCCPDLQCLPPAKETP